ncbi:ATP-binding protein [Vibrio parahaemolyticus]|uniref:ATP-binding protein n=1 Tax=Vibrio parahaemolyticus TaxID=670 RepID=UPI0031CC3AE5
MTESNKNLIKIDEKDIEKHYTTAMNLINRFNYSNKDSASDSSSSSFSMASSLSNNTLVEINKSILNVTPNDALASESQHKVIHALRRALSVSTAINEQYTNFSGLSDLDEKIKRNQYLTDEEKTRRSEMSKTLTIIGTHVIASYIVHALGAHTTTSNVEAETYTIDVSSNLNALYSMLNGLNENVKNQAKSDEILINVVVDYFEKVISNNQRHVEGLKHLSAYESNTFFIEKDKFEVNGFEKISKNSTKKVQMKRVEPHEVVGNAIAKQHCLKIVKKLLCYDFERKMNPFVEIGGFPFTILGDGKPGTGKTTLIQMTSTLLSDYCERLGLPYYYENFSTDNISEYQGKSAQNAKAFINNVMNPDCLGFGTVDDIDQIAGKRGDSKSSAGQQEVTAVLMESFAGAKTIVRGNCIFGMFTNHAENMDPALRQRAITRFLIDGPKTKEDFADLFYILSKNKTDIPYGDNEPLSTQEIQTAVQESYEQHNKPQEPQLLEVYEATVKQLGHEFESFEDVALYCDNVMSVYPDFSGRSVANIVSSALGRAADADIPEEWFEERSVFIDKSYDEKLEMIQKYIKKLEISYILQEFNSYMDSEFRSKNKSDNEEVNERVRQARLNEKATILLQKEREAKNNQ